MNNQRWTFIIVYFLVKNIFSLIENIFTSINGVCTDIQEHRTNHKIYYIVIVTDYINKREIRIKIDSNLFVNKGDNISVVHGIFSKQVVSMNLIKIARTEIVEIVFPMIFMFLLL